MDTRGHTLLSNAFVLPERNEGTNFAILQTVARYVLCRRLKKHNLKNKYLNQDVQPMEFISMDLAGELHPPLIQR